MVIYIIEVVSMKNRRFEVIIICMLIGIIICLVFPIVEKIIYKSQLSGIESSVHGAISSVQVLYTKSSLKTDIELPFTVEYTENSYKLYSGISKITLKDKIDSKGRKPIGGKIVITKTGEILAKNLKFEKFTCNKEHLKMVECQKNS